MTNLDNILKTRDITLLACEMSAIVQQSEHSLALPPSYTEYIMRNSGLEEAQAGVKIARRNINNLRYADDTTFMAESEEEQKSLLMKVKEESEKLV